MNCKSCGLPLLGTESFCPQCGLPLKGQARPATPASAGVAAPPAAAAETAKAPAEVEAQPEAEVTIDVPLEAWGEEELRSPVVEAVDVPLEVAGPVAAERERIRPESVRPAAPAYAPPVSRAGARRRVGLVGPLGLGVMAGCLFLFILGLGGLGIYHGQQLRSDRQYREAIVHYERGVAYLQQGAYELAAAEFEYALRLRPNYPEAQQKLAEARAKASQQPSPTSQESHEDPSILLAEGQAAYDRGDWDEAIRILEPLHLQDPSYEQAAVRRLLAGAYANSGLWLVNESRLEEAIRRFDQALALEPDNPDIQLQSRLATLYQAGLTAWGVDWGQAIRNLAAGYALKPDYKDIAERLQRAYVQAGDAAGAQSTWCEAVEYYKLALDLSPSPDVATKRDDAAHRCASPVAAPGDTPAPGGTYVGVYGGLVDNRQRTTDWATIKGRVVNAAGEGVPDVKVRLSAFDWSSVHTTGPTGEYGFENLMNEITFTVSLVDLPMQPVDVATKFGWISLADFVEVP
jgi:tetratricopeptide (TPR) repeat protein